MYAIIVLLNLAAINYSITKLQVMKATEFKKAISEAKESLRGKKLTIDLVNGEAIKKFSFLSLKAFGNAILEMEKMGAGFGFIKVGNDLIQRGI